MRLIVTAATAATQPSANPKRPAASIRALIRGSSSGLRRGRSTPQTYMRSIFRRRPLHERKVPSGPILVRAVVELGRIAEGAGSEVGHAGPISDVAVRDYGVAGLHARRIELGQRRPIEKLSFIGVFEELL